jgi:hypothetical protein
MASSSKTTKTRLPIFIYRDNTKSVEEDAKQFDNHPEVKAGRRIERFYRTEAFKDPKLLGWKIVAAC